MPDRRSESDDRAEWAKAWGISSQIVTMCLELVGPPLLGFFADRRLGTFPVCLIVGTVFGFVVVGYHLMGLARSLPPPSQGNKPEDECRSTSRDSETDQHQ